MEITNEEFEKIALNKYGLECSCIFGQKIGIGVKKTMVNRVSECEVHFKLGSDGTVRIKCSSPLGLD